MAVNASRYSERTHDIPSTNQQEEIYIRGRIYPSQCSPQKYQLLFREDISLRMAQEVISTSNSQQKDYYKNCIDLFKSKFIVMIGYR